LIPDVQIYYTSRVKIDRTMAPRRPEPCPPPKPTNQHGISLRDYIDSRLDAAERFRDEQQHSHESAHKEAVVVQAERDERLNDVRTRFLPRSEFEIYHQALLKLRESDMTTIRNLLIAFTLLLVSTLAGVIVTLAVK